MSKQILLPDEFESASDKKVIAAHKAAVNLIKHYNDPDTWSVNTAARFRARKYLREIFHELCKRGLDKK